MKELWFFGTYCLNLRSRFMKSQYHSFPIGYSILNSVEWKFLRTYMTRHMFSFNVLKIDIFFSYNPVTENSCECNCDSFTNECSFSLACFHYLVASLCCDEEYMMLQGIVWADVLLSYLPSRTGVYCEILCLILALTSFHYLVTCSVFLCVAFKLISAVTQFSNPLFNYL